MDAVKFLQERKRMFLNGDSSLIYSMEDGVYPEILVRNVEQWSAAHPLKTRQSVFLEQYPEAIRDSEDILSVCPQYLNGNIKCRDGVGCPSCRREFWMQEVE